MRSWFRLMEAEEWRNEQRSAAYARIARRKYTRTSCEGDGSADGLQSDRSPKRPKGDVYTPDSYRRAIQYGIQKSNRLQRLTDDRNPLIPSWHPNQLRHSFATTVRKRFGVEAAQVGLGHARTDVVEVYAEKNYHLAVNVAKLIG